MTKDKTSDLLIGAVLLVGLRLTLLITTSDTGVLTRWTDTQFYYQIARWLDMGRLPYLHYWMEYPPIFPFLSTGVYWLSARLGGFQAYQIILALVLLAFDLGTFVLVYRIGRHLGGESRGRRAAWAWAMLGYPLYIWRYSFDGMAVFFLLLGIDRALAERRTLAGAVLSVGAMVKLFPALAIPPSGRRAGRAIGWVRPC